MKIIRGYQKIPESARGCVVTLGNYDGVHKGHQVVLAHLKAKAEALNVPLVVMCFEPTPREFFNADTAPARLTSLREKAQLLNAQGVDFLLLQRFDQAFSQLLAAEFIQRVLIDTLAVRAVVVGDDFRFGAARQGDVSLLRQFGDAQGFEVIDTQTVAADNERISSTAVREQLAQANLAAAEQLLGRPFTMEGRVAHGDKLGRQLGFPTANIAFRGNRLPLQGVYAVKVYGVDTSAGSALYGVANLGSRPAVNGTEERLEVYLFDWQGDLYGQRLRVEFVAFIRPEQRFPSIDALKAAIADDVLQGKKLFEKVGVSSH